MLPTLLNDRARVKRQAQIATSHNTNLFGIEKFDKVSQAIVLLRLAARAPGPTRPLLVEVVALVADQEVAPCCIISDVGGHEPGTCRPRPLSQEMTSNLQERLEFTALYSHKPLVRMVPSLHFGHVRTISPPDPRPPSLSVNSCLVV